MRHSPCLRQRLQQRADDVFVDALERFHFFIRLALVRRLVRRLDVDADEVVVRQGGDGVPALGGVVGVEVAGGAGHVDALPAEQHADAAHQIDRADDGPALAVLPGERLQRRRLALAPQPDLRRRSLALRRAGLVDGVFRQDGPTAFHEVAQQVTPRPLRQMVGDRLVRDVVRRLRLRVGGERRGFFRSENENIAVADAGMEFQSAAWDGAAERGVNGLDKRPAFFAGDVAGREVAHLAVLDMDEVAADGPVVGAERNAHRGGFERRPAGVDGEGVVAEQAEAWPRRWPASAARGTLLERPTTPVRAMRSMFGLRAACNGVLPPSDSCAFVGAAVGDDDDVLHAGSVGGAAAVGQRRQ